MLPVKIMKTELLAALLSLSAICAHGQGTFIYDQQDSTVEGSFPIGSFHSLQSMTSPWGQSFTPSLSGVDFIRLELVDGTLADGLGAAVYLELASGSIAGPTIGATTSVAMPNGYSGPATFFFPTTEPLMPGVQYFFRPILQSGGTWNIVEGPYQYSGGNQYNQGAIYPGGNLWFREGLYVVPEPSSVALLLLGGAALACLRRLRRK